MKKTLTIILVISSLFMMATDSMAKDEQFRRDYAVGWQISGAGSGFSIKIPYQNDYYFQPVFSVAMSQKETLTTGNYAFGVRGIHNLEKRQDFLPYIGAALGYSKNFEKAADSSSSNSRFGYQGFFGVEYQKYLLRPAFEIGIGGTNHSDGSFQAGVICNLSVLYYF